MAITYKAYRVQREQQRLIVEFLEAQERDHYAHSINKERYESMLLTLPDGQWKTRVTQLLAEVDSRIEEVESIIAATQAQAPDDTTIDEIMAEIRAERNAAASAAAANLGRVG